MKIAVTTPTGQVGRHVVRALVRAGVRPLLLARDPARLDPALAGLVDVGVVDLADADAVVRATAGVDALYWVDPSPAGADPLAEHATYAASVVAAVSAHRVLRVVFQSSVGAELRDGAGEIDGLGATEVALDAACASAGTSVVHLRCGFFFTNLLMMLDDLRSGTVPVLLPTDRPLPWVDPRDVAEVASATLLAPPVPSRRVQAVHGPEHLSWDQAAAVVSRACGVPVRAEQVPDDVVREAMLGAGLPPAVVESVMGMSTGLRDGFVPEQGRDVTTTSPSTLAGWCATELAPVLGAG